VKRQRRGERAILLKNISLKIDSFAAVGLKNGEGRRRTSRSRRRGEEKNLQEGIVTGSAPTSLGQGNLEGEGRGKVERGGGKGLSFNSSFMGQENAKPLSQQKDGKI